MEIVFGSRKLQKLCNSVKEMQGTLGDRGSKSLQTRLAQLAAAETLADLGKVPGARCHELSGDRKGHLAVDLVHPRRLVFGPDDRPLPTKDDGGLDWNKVTRIIICEIVDYH